MKKEAKEAIKTGARNAVKAVSLVALIVPLTIIEPINAIAYVKPEYIVAEISGESYEDRKIIKEGEAQEIEEYFAYRDEYGNVLSIATPEEVAKAISISDILNAYNDYETNEYSYTCKSEVLNLNINGMYDELLADEATGFNNFGSNHIGDKPAVDAFLNFSCGTIAEEMKARIEAKIDDELRYLGMNVTKFSKVRVIEDRVYAVARVDDHILMIRLHGDTLDLLAYLDNRYQMIMNNICGKVDDVHPNSICVNGIDYTTNETTWQSLGDDDLKDRLYIGLASLSDMDYDLSVHLGGDGFFVWEDQELNDMRALEFSEEEIANAISSDAYLELSTMRLGNTSQSL